MERVSPKKAVNLKRPARVKLNSAKSIGAKSIAYNKSAKNANNIQVKRPKLKGE